MGQYLFSFPVPLPPFVFFPFVCFSPFSYLYNYPSSPFPHPLPAQALASTSAVQDTAFLGAANTLTGPAAPSGGEANAASASGGADINLFKCTVPDCNKSFRKESLLLSHIKFYHPKHASVAVPKKKGGVAGSVVKPASGSAAAPSTELAPRPKPAAEKVSFS